jgi:hypothetical protein
MNHLLKTSTNTSLGRIFSACFIILQCLAPMSEAADNDQEVLNQLYQEIISSFPAGKSVKMDSMRTHGAIILADPREAPTSEKITDPVSERLEKEIENIIRDAKIRHSDAVKFMQDAK